MSYAEVTGEDMVTLVTREIRPVDNAIIPQPWAEHATGSDIDSKVCRVCIVYNSFWISGPDSRSTFPSRTDFLYWHVIFCLTDLAPLFIV